MKIAIMGAMIEEVDPFLEAGEHEPLLKYFKKHSDVKHAGNHFHEAKYKDLDIVLSYSKIGKVNAALTAAMMIGRSSFMIPNTATPESIRSRNQSAISLSVSTLLVRTSPATSVIPLMDSFWASRASNCSRARSLLS